VASLILPLTATAAANPAYRDSGSYPCMQCTERCLNLQGSNGREQGLVFVIAVGLFEHYYCTTDICAGSLRTLSISLIDRQRGKVPCGLLPPRRRACHK
jgi:hypothetical protein